MEDEIISCFFVLAHKEQDQLFAIHEKGHTIVIGELGSKSESSKQLTPLVSRTNIYLNPTKMVREYQADGFELITTLCIKGYNYRDAMEMFRAACRVKNTRAIRSFLSHKDGVPLLELLLNMDAKDERCIALQAMAERIMDKMQTTGKAKESNHAG